VALEVVVTSNNQTFEHLNVDVCEGIVLGRYGGTVKQMYLPFFVGLGGRISSGQQWFPWIHADDVAGIYAHAIENDSVTVSDCLTVAVRHSWVFRCNL